MRKGKMVAQGAHASNSFITRELFYSGECFKINFDEYEEEVVHWLDNSFRKICVSVNSEDELIEVHEAALAAGLISHLIEDNGITEFGGVKTKTCLAIGPHWDDKFVGITDHLTLL